MTWKDIHTQYKYSKLYTGNQSYRQYHIIIAVEFKGFTVFYKTFIITTGKLSQRKKQPHHQYHF